MNTLVAFSLLVAAVLAEPQYYYGGVVPTAYSGIPTAYSGVYGGVLPVAGSYVGSPVVAKGYPYVTSPAVTPYVATVTYPSQDTSRGLPQPVQDTAEVKYAKAVFAKQYENAAVTAALGSNVPLAVHSIHKRAAVLPYVPYKTPASTSPLVYSAVHSPVVSTPYVSTYGSQYVASPYAYNYGVAPYTTYY